MDRQSRETGGTSRDGRSEMSARMREVEFDMAGKPDEGGDSGQDGTSLAGGQKQGAQTQSTCAQEYADGAEQGPSKAGSAFGSEGSEFEPGSPDIESESPEPWPGGTESESDGTDSEPGSQGSTEAAEPGEKKKGFFAKKKDKKDEQIEDLTDRLRRSMAEFDNYRKRTEKEKAAMYEIGARDMIEKILLVVDNFERGLATIPEGEEKGAFADGMDKIYKQLLKMLEDVGVTSIESVGRPFDPNYHNAVMHIEDESLGENIVAEEFQKGYLYRDNVVRHSMVKVAN